MKRKNWRKAALSLTLSVSLALGSLVALPPRPAEADIGDLIGAAVYGAAYSSQLNKQLKYYNDTEEGRQDLLAQIKKQYGVNEDYTLNARLRSVMTNLSAAIAEVDPTINDKPYLYFVNNDQSFNAFCTLGHVMSVNTGAFTTLTNEDELAVVLGHEMGHGQKDHPAKGAKKSIGPAVLAAATGGSILGNLAANAWNNQGITKPMEKEADALAFTYLTHSNYNPGATAAVWQRILDKSDGKDASSSFVWVLAGGSDHPSDTSRRDTYEKSLTEYSNKHVTNEDGTIYINKKEFTTPAAAGDMSAKERAYFVMGNLAAAYHNGHDKESVTVEGSTVKLGPQPILTCTSGDESPDVLAKRLEEIK